MTYYQSGGEAFEPGTILMAANTTQMGRLPLLINTEIRWVFPFPLGTSYDGCSQG